MSGVRADGLAAVGRVLLGSEGRMSMRYHGRCSRLWTWCLAAPRCSAAHALARARPFRCEVTMLVPQTFNHKAVAPAGGKAMRAVPGWLKDRVVPLGLLALVGAGCGQANNDDTPAVTTTAPSATTAGPAAFVAEARTMAFGTKDLAAASDEELLKVGKLVCDGLGPRGLDYGRVVQRLVRSEACPTPAQASALVNSAVRNLCPQHADAIPS